MQQVFSDKAPMVKFGGERGEEYEEEWSALPLLVLAAFSLFIVYWFRYFLTATPYASTDLSGHIALVERMQQHWKLGEFTFYDPLWFGGWPAFHFYGFLPHLFAGVFASLLQFYFSDAALVSVHVLSVLGVALLPFSIYYAAIPLARQIWTSRIPQFDRAQFILAVFVGVFSFWFVNHDAKGLGIGGAAVFQVGLYPQLFGWHCLLLYLGALFRLLHGNGKRPSILLVILITLSLLSHNLSFLFCMFIGVMTFLVSYGRRYAVALSHLIGVGLGAFWLIPLMAEMPDYTTLSVVGSRGDFFELLFRYPLQDIWTTILSWTQGIHSNLDLTNILTLILAVGLLSHPLLHRSRTVIVAFVIVLLAVTVLSSKYVATSLPLGIHYYRFLGSALLAVIVILACVPVAFFRDAVTTSLAGAWLCVVQLSIVSLAMICFLSGMALEERSFTRLKKEIPTSYFDSQNELLEYLKNEDQVGRVLFEYQADDTVQKFPTPHYLSSRIGGVAGIETVNGLMTQSSLAYQFPTVSAQELGIEMYSVDLFISPLKTKGDAERIEELIGFGVTHIVTTRGVTQTRLADFLIAPVKTFAQFHVLRISESPRPIVRPVDKELVGYFDSYGDLPFKFIEHYFHSHPELSQRFSLIALEDKDRFPPGMAALILNGSLDRLPDRDLSSKMSVYEIEIWPSTVIDPYRPKLKPNRERYTYFSLERYLDRTLKLIPSLLSLPEVARSSSSTSPTLKWEPNFQAFKLDGLEPGKMVLIDYSYFPYWLPNSGDLFRGFREKMFFLPERTSASFVYDRWSQSSTRLGVAISLLSVFILLLTRIRHN